MSDRPTTEEFSVDLVHVSFRFPGGSFGLGIPVAEKDTNTHRVLRRAEDLYEAARALIERRAETMDSTFYEAFEAFQEEIEALAHEHGGRP